MISANEIYRLSIEERRNLIMRHVNRLGGEPELAKSNVINTFILDYIAIKRRLNNCQDHQYILSNNEFNSRLSIEIDNFLPLARLKIQESKPSREQVSQSCANIYELSGATTLASCNKVSRALSTILGLFWERVADISPYVISPESEFGIKIQGVDIISMNVLTSNIEYIQMKTQRNTLTGSQVPRVNDELGRHPNPVFCACFDTNAAWTFSVSSGIPRRCGSEFWSSIGIEYQVVLRSVTNLIRHLETLYIEI